MKSTMKNRKTLLAALALIIMALPLCALAEQSAPSGEYLCPECRENVTLGEFVSSGDSQCAWKGSCGHTIRVDHDYAAVEEVPATCTQDGLKGEICRYCGYRPTLNALGHSYVYEPVDGSYHKKRCTRPSCTESVTERHAPAADASGNPIWTFDEAVERHYERCDKCAMTLNNQACDFIVASTLPATCTQEGQQMLRCTVCGGHKTEILPAGHDWSAWTQNGAASERVCRRAGCGAKEICDHLKNINPPCAAAPVCSVCGAALEKQAHDWQAVSYRWNGDECTAVRACRLCRTEEIQSVRALGQSVRATCTEKGYTKYEPAFEGWAKDESGASVRIVYTADALGHEWCPWKNGERNCLRAGCGAVEKCAHPDEQVSVYGAEWPAELPADGALPAASIAARCRQCGETLNLGAAAVRRAAEGDSPASCTRDASTRYEALDGAGRVISQRDYAVKGTALGHDWAYSYTWDTAGGTCTGRAVCRRDGSHVYETSVAYTTDAHPACTEKTVATLTAVFPEIADRGLWIGGRTETTARELNAVGHDDAQTVVPPTCTERGYTVYTCRRCGRVEKANGTPALEHDFVDWTPVEGENAHTAACRREGCGETARAECTLRPMMDGETGEDTFCPICGRLSAGGRLELIEDARLDAFAGEIALPGSPVLRRGALSDGRVIISLCFEAAGEVVRPAARVTLSLPADGENALYDWAASETVGAGIALNVAVNDEGRIALELDYALDEGETIETAADTLIVVLKPLAEEEIDAQA